MTWKDLALMKIFYYNFCGYILAVQGRQNVFHLNYAFLCKIINIIAKFMQS